MSGDDRTATPEQRAVRALKGVGAALSHLADMLSGRPDDAKLRVDQAFVDIAHAETAADLGITVDELTRRIERLKSSAA